MKVVSPKPQRTGRLTHRRFSLMPMGMRLGLIFCACLALFGCHKPAPKVWTPPVIPPCILDDALQRPEFADAIKQAEQVYPDDIWGTKPWRINESQDRREYAVATNVLAVVEPKFSHMTVTELVRALKLIPSPGVEQFDGVSGYVYEIGNHEIVKEIEARPKNELGVLAGMADDKVEIYDGPQGFSETLDAWIHLDILKDR